MLSNFFRVSFRYLSKNRTYSLINILGLAMGMACFALLTLFVKKELSYDEFHQDKESVYMMFMADSAETDFEYAMQAPAGPHVKETIPEISHAVRFGGVGNILARVNGEKYIIPKINYTDADLFSVFDFKLLNTDAENVTLEKKQIILSRSEAERLYGSVDAAIGADFEFIDLDMMTVVAVFEDLPDETHLNFDVLVTFDYVDDLIFWKSNFTVSGDRAASDWGFISAFPTYIKLANPDTDLDALKAKLHEAILPHQGFKEFELLRLDDVYFSDLYKSYFGEKGDLSQVNLYITIAVVLLLIAIVNYTNMATARYSRRAKEVGIRKTIGGHRSQIVRQFLVESISIALFSLILAICLAEMSMPFFNSYTGKEVGISYSSPFTYLIFIGGALFIGFIAGIYPAFYLSKFNPLHNLSGRSSSKGGKFFRQMLVGFQFTTCLALMAVTGIVYSQFNHMNTLDKGFESEQLVNIPLKGEDTRESFQTMKAELLKNPYVEAVSGASFSVFENQTNFYVKLDNQEEQVPMALMIAESNFLDMLGVRLVSGQLFTDMPESERREVTVVNQSVVEKAAWENPIGEDLSGRKVGGVVDDFIFSSAKNAISPLMIFASKENDNSHDTMYLKLTGNIKLGLDHIEDVFMNFSEEYPFEFAFVDDQFAENYEDELKLSQVLGIFSGLTIFIAGLGILGLSIFIAEQRVKEIGIRRVLGASLGNVVWLLNSAITKLILVVSLITLPAVYYFIGDWLDNFAYNISLNGLYFLLPLALLIGIVWSILFYQSFRSARANPVNALRTE